MFIVVIGPVDVVESDVIVGRIGVVACGLRVWMSEKSVHDVGAGAGWLVGLRNRPQCLGRAVDDVVGETKLVHRLSTFGDTGDISPHFA